MKLRSDVPPRELLPALKRHDQWLCWYGRPDDGGGLRKKPFPHYDCSLWEPGIARYADPDNWLRYDEARDVRDSSDRSLGLGFVLSADDGFLVVDVDGCIDDDEGLDPSVAGLLDEAGSYAEISPSGDGVHLLLRGELPRQGWTEQPDGYRLEFYDEFFVTVTQHHVEGTPRSATSSQDVVDDLFARYEVSWPGPKFTSFWPERNRR